MPRSPKLILKGETALIKKLKRLGDRRKLKKVVRRATTSSAQVVVKGVRQKWPVESGLSKKSVTKKIISTRAGFSAIIGIDKDAIGEAHGRQHIPSNIDHLIELGFQHPGGKSVPAVAPLRRGFEASKHAAEAEFERKATAEIEKEAKKG